MRRIALIAVLFLFAAKQGDMSAEIERAIKGEQLGSAPFKKSVSAVLKKYAVDHNGEFEMQHTIGDKRGLLLTAHSTSDDPNQFPIWWRIFVWPDGTQNRVQLLKKGELYNMGGTFTEGEVFWRDDRIIIAGSEVTGGNGERAALTAYRFLGGHWKMIQHIEDKREGFAKFARNEKAVDPSRVRVVTRDWPKHLQQPHVGPLLRYESAWQLKGSSYVRGATHMTYTPLAELETLAGYVAGNKRHDFNVRVPGPFREKLWTNLKKYMAVYSVSSDVYDTTNSFQFGEDGPTLAMRMVGNRWTVAQWNDNRKGK